MSNKIIGIKQADGSFYPILEEGRPASKTIELTTVRDGQTTIKVNLYKKTDHTDEKPSYVDTLLIENLVPHPKNVPTFDLSISLDENNVLTAEVLDPETGAKSDTAVSLITLSEAQLADFPDFTIADDTSKSLSYSTAEDFGGSVSDIDKLSFKKMDFDLPDFDNIDVSDAELDEAGLSFDKTDIDDTSITGTAFSSKPDFDLPDFDNIDVSDAELDEAGLSFDKTDIDDTSIAGTAFSSKPDFDLPDFDTIDIDNTDIDNTAFEMPAEESTNMSKQNKYEEHVSFTPPLYDSSLNDDIEEPAPKKKCRIALIICIICAILCILAVIGIFFFGPWPGKTEVADSNVVAVESPKVLEKTEAEAKTKQAETISPAPEENAIVIVTKDEVLPVKPDPVTEEPQAAIRYLIKWGDTLWDLSDTYYRNPWLYPLIAKENKIKNPNLIIAGTYLNIPRR